MGGNSDGKIGKEEMEEGEEVEEERFEHHEKDCIDVAQRMR